MTRPKNMRLFALSLTACLAMSACLQTSPTKEAEATLHPSVQTADTTWSRSSWHPDMRFYREHNGRRGGYTRSGWTSSGNVLSHQFNIVSAPHPVRYGSHSERFEVRPTDYDGMEGRTRGNRSELLQRPAANNPRIGEDNWFGWSFYHENLVEVDHTYGWFPKFGQWKTNLEAPPIISIEPAHDGKQGGGQYIGVSLDDMSNGQSIEWLRANNHGVPCRLFRIEESRGRWTDIVVNTDFGADENGYLNIWINGALRCEYRGQITVTPVDPYTSYGNRNHGPVFKRGYWSGHLSFPSRWLKNHPNIEIPKFVVYYDEWRQGRTREEVDIRIIEAKGGRPVD